MDRIATNELLAWKDRKDRNRLVVRGARQVGKTHLVEAFGAAHFEQTVTLNFEREPVLASLFERSDPRETIRLIEARRRTAIRPGATLLSLRTRTN